MSACNCYYNSSDGFVSSLLQARSSDIHIFFNRNIRNSHFCRLQLDPELFLDDTPIPAVQEKVKFFVLISDSKLSFNASSLSQK